MLSMLNVAMPIYVTYIHIFKIVPGDATVQQV